MYAFKGADNPCGFCLNTGSICEIYLLRHGDSATSIDMSKSRCQNLRKIKLKLAEKFTEKQPCTNHPLLCELCPRGAPAIWKYNLRSHIFSKHASANPNVYEPSYCLHGEEKTRMKSVYLTRKRVRASGKSTGPTLLVSDVHSSRLALRWRFILIRLAFI
jgi:hypothetical protein